MVLAEPLIRRNECAGGEDGRMIMYSNAKPESGGEEDCDMRFCPRDLYDNKERELRPPCFRYRDLACSSRSSWMRFSSIAARVTASFRRRSFNLSSRYRVTDWSHKCSQAASLFSLCFSKARSCSLFWDSFKACSSSSSRMRRLKGKSSS